MQYCGPKALPHSVFLSWDTDDQDKALAWMLADAEKCNRCGTVSAEWLDEEGREVEDPPYDAVSQLCVGCQALSDKQEEVDPKRRPFVNVFLRRRPWKPS